MLVFLFPFFENLGSYEYDSMRARTVLFLKGIIAAIFFVEKLYGMRARALVERMLARAARGRSRRLGCSRSTRRQRRKVDKCRVADKKQTNKQTDKHTLLFYRYRSRLGTHVRGRDRGRAYQALIYTYKRVVCGCLLVCWFVCLLFIGHTTFVHFAALPPSVREQPSGRGRPRARGQPHAQREHARACRTTSQRKNRCAR